MAVRLKRQLGDFGGTVLTDKQIYDMLDHEKYAFSAELLEFARRVESAATLEGWVLVPKEPTDEMVKAGNIGQGFSHQALRAAIAAAPLPSNASSSADER